MVLFLAKSLKSSIHQGAFFAILGTYILIGFVGRVFAHGLEDQGSVPGRIIPKTQRKVLDTSFLNTQHYKVRIKGKAEQSGGRIGTLPYTSV